MQSVHNACVFVCFRTCESVRECRFVVSACEISKLSNKQ